jgi:hypothetical protein
MEGVDSSKYDRLARFLDGLDRADPNALEEPYRSLWFRIKDLDPRSIRTVRTETAGPAQAAIDVSDFVIDESEPVEVASLGGRERRIEVISPSQVGPTFEMKVETKPKVTFKAAGDDEVETVRRKETAAKCLLQVQEALVPLKGVDGEAKTLFSKNKDMAKHYREGDYVEVEAISKAIISTLASQEFRQSMMLRLQKKLKEYEEAGIEMGPARERFKQLAASYKEDRPDFASLAGACNKLAEDAARAVLGDPEEAEVIVAEIVKGPMVPAASSIAETAKKEITHTPPKQEVHTPPSSTIGPSSEPRPVEVAPAPVQAPPTEVPKPAEDLKPIIKIVRKKLVAVDDEGGAPQTVLSPAASTEPAVSAPPVEKLVPRTETAPQAKTAPAAAPPSEKKKVQEVKNTESDDLQEAYKRIMSVYNAASKMHAAGKDMNQLFDLYNFAEEARKKGDNKIYIGVSKQLESMLISMQTKK